MGPLFSKVYLVIGHCVHTFRYANRCLNTIFCKTFPFKYNFAKWRVVNIIDPANKIDDLRKSAI